MVVVPLIVVLESVVRPATFKRPASIVLPELARKVPEIPARVLVPVTVAAPTTWRVELAIAEVPRANVLLALFQLKSAFELNPPVPFENWIKPAVPEAVEVAI